MSGVWLLCGACVAAGLLDSAAAPAPHPPHRAGRSPGAGRDSRAECPVVDGVVDADRCLGGFNATDSTTSLQAALNAPGAHTVLISNRSRPTPWITGPLKLQASNRTIYLVSAAAHTRGRLVREQNASFTLGVVRACPGACSWCGGGAELTC